MTIPHDPLNPIALYYQDLERDRYRIVPNASDVRSINEEAAIRLALSREEWPAPWYRDGEINRPGPDRLEAVAERYGIPAWLIGSALDVLGLHHKEPSEDLRARLACALENLDRSLVTFPAALEAIDAGPRVQMRARAYYNEARIAVTRGDHGRTVATYRISPLETIDFSIRLDERAVVEFGACEVWRVRT